MYLNCLVTLLLYSFSWKICYCSDLYSDRVKKYDSETFKQNIGTGIPHFVNFFAPWCGYCKRLKPVWDELAEKYNVDVPNQKIIIAKVDCTTETPLCADQGISGYPSLVLYEAKGKKGLKYQGKRDLEGLEEYISLNLDGTIRKKTITPLHSKPENGALELTEENFRNTIDWGVHFVKFYAPWCGHCQKMAHAWGELAESTKNDKSVTVSKVDCTVNKKACIDFEIKGFPTLLWIVNGKKVEKYQGARNLAGFKQFIADMKAVHKETLDTEEGKIPDVAKNADALVVELSKDNFENAVAQGLSFIKFFVPWCGHSQRLAPVWSNVAQKFAANTKVKIAKVDCTQDEELCNTYNVVGYPTLLLFRDGEKITEYHGPRLLENLHNFVLEYLHHGEL